MTSSTAPLLPLRRSASGHRPRPTAGFAAAVLAATVLGVAITAVLAPAAVAADATNPGVGTPGTTCHLVDATVLGRDTGANRVALDDSGLTLVREHDQIHVEGDAVAVSSISVGDELGGWRTLTGTTGEIHLAGYTGIEVCWATPATDRDAGAQDVGVQAPAQEGAQAEPPTGATGTDGLPQDPAVGGTTTTAATGTSSDATATTTATTATTPAAIPAIADATAAAPAALHPARPHLAVTGASTGLLATWSGGALLLGALLLGASRHVLRTRAARAAKIR